MRRRPPAPSPWGCPGPARRSERWPDGRRPDDDGADAGWREWCGSAPDGASWRDAAARPGDDGRPADGPARDGAPGDGPALAVPLDRPDCDAAVDGACRRHDGAGSGRAQDAAGAGGAGRSGAARTDGLAAEPGRPGGHDRARPAGARHDGNGALLDAEPERPHLEDLPCALARGRDGHDHRRSRLQGRERPDPGGRHGCPDRGSTRVRVGRHDRHLQVPVQARLPLAPHGRADAGLGGHMARSLWSFADSNGYELKLLDDDGDLRLRLDAAGKSAVSIGGLTSSVFEHLARVARALEETMPGESPEETSPPKEEDPDAPV